MRKQTTRNRPHYRQRRGVVTVEFAITVPLLFFLFFSALEFSRANMLRHSIQTAAYEGARRAIVPGATAANANDAARSILAAVGAVNASVVVTPTVIDKTTREVTIDVSVPLDDNAWVVPKFFGNRTLSNSITLKREVVDQDSF